MGNQLDDAGNPHLSPLAPAQRLEVFELRRYVTRPGKRDDLIGLFEREFLESQEACGMVPVGHFRNLDDPDSFVWIRGFPNVARRCDALENFYLKSDIWRDHRDAANATLVDSDNVLLLKSAREGSGFDLSGLARPEPGWPSMASFVGIAIAMLRAPADQEFLEDVEIDVLPRIDRIAKRVALLVTDERPNDFPRLPVRDGEHAFVVAAVCADQSALDAWTRAFDRTGWEVLRLVPGARSLFR